jgi:hypothetical protein
MCQDTSPVYYLLEAGSETGTAEARKPAFVQRENVDVGPTASRHFTENAKMCRDQTLKFSRFFAKS